MNCASLTRAAACPSLVAPARGPRAACQARRPFVPASTSNGCRVSTSRATGGRRRAPAPQPLRAAADDEVASFDFQEPETAREAIDLGLVLCKHNKWDKALAVFEKGLTLPGTGIKRFRDKPRLISDGEKMAALYNIACCHSQLQDARSGLVALSGCMELGYTDFAQIRSDPDLDFLRQDSRFEGLMARFQKKGGGFLGLDLSGIFGGNK